MLASFTNTDPESEFATEGKPSTIQNRREPLYIVHLLGVGLYQKAAAFQGEHVNFQPYQCANYCRSWGYEPERTKTALTGKFSDKTNEFTALRSRSHQMTWIRIKSSR
jgi:hypothetical protein